ncbi:MAG: DUF4412 domain-containing protein [Calditrichaeota bacterium]|nr:DUF4412 domain-containing protein [Calditrichota bacterium]RQV93516.1 MAG: DUF4412 domain-containing protein [bacterium]RQW06430.1 MAG: DUF4412 domain-containing protein [Calditrichota bacterium]
MNHLTKIKFFIMLIVFMISGTIPAEDFQGKIVYEDLSLMAEAFPSLRELEDFQSPEYREAMKELFAKSPEELRKIAVKNSGKDYVETENSTIYIKGYLYRVDEMNEGENQSIIYDLKSNSMKIIRWDEKTVLTAPLNELDENLEQMLELPPEDMVMDTPLEEDLFSMEPANQKTTIIGYECELYVGTNSEGEYTHIWLTDQNQKLVNAYLRIMNIIRDDFDSGQEPDSEDKFFTEKKGFEIRRYTGSSFSIDIEQVKEISEETVPDKLFKTPAGFVEISLQEMIEQEM